MCCVTIIVKALRTCEVERRVSTDDAEPGLRVRGVAVVDADVRGPLPTSLARCQNSEEEQLAARQQHPVDGRVLVGGDDRLTVAVPGDARRGLTFSLAVQRRRLVAHHVLVLGVFDDERVRDLSYVCTRSHTQREFTLHPPSLILLSSMAQTGDDSNDLGPKAKD